MATPKPKPQTIDEYISSYPENVQRILQTLRQTIKEVAPDAQETIKYGMPTFVLHGNLVYFGAWKKHIGLYPITGEMEAAFEELAQYSTSGKGTVQFPLNEPLPLPLIRKIVEMRVRENTAKNEQTG
ncbi:MAG: DUF1801 domain-containing protein [Anaerolineae bacterium]|nr:DUF1801 domain-containing protein [Anaerolineae bacterium]